MPAFAMRFLARQLKPAASWPTSTRTLPHKGRFRPRAHSAGSPFLRTFRPKYLPASYRILLRVCGRTPYGDVSPRLGFVWQMTEKPVLVLRGGYGIYFDQHSTGIVESGLSQPPYSTGNIVQGAANGAATLQSPLRSSRSAQFKLSDLPDAQLKPRLFRSRREPIRT